MQESRPNRRTFLMHSTAASAGAMTALSLARNAYAGGDDTIKVALVGCGGRGTGAAEQNLTADPGTRLVAMADAFRDRLEESLSTLQASPVADRIDVPEDRRFSGFDAYKQATELADLVILATPPGFRPIHFAHVVEKGKHAFVEKPMAVDGPGLRTFMEAAEKSRKLGLSAVNGFCWRYHGPRRELMKRVGEGAIGDVIAIETAYNSQGVWDPRKTREQCDSEMEYQMRNWYYYDWLSGDQIVEQAIHGLDTMAWVTGDVPPIRCWGVGGRQARTDAKYGNIWDHFAIVYEYENGVRGYHQCRHWPNTPNRVQDILLGSKGQADVFGLRITGDDKWRYRGDNPNMYQTEHDELYSALRSGKPINNVEQAAHTTTLALMGRTAGYTGEIITYDQMLTSETDLVPTEFSWGDAPDRPVPIPGVTQYA